MILSEFMKEISTIHNPPDRKIYFSMLVDNKMSKLEKAYRDKSINYLNKLKVEIKEKDLPSIARTLAAMASNRNSRLVMILDKLIES